MKRTGFIVVAAVCCAAIVFLSVHRRGGIRKPVNPYYESYIKRVVACEDRNTEWREAEDRAREEAWKKYGERYSRTGLGNKDCKAEAWEAVERLPFSERVEARKQIELALGAN